MSTPKDLKRQSKHEYRKARRYVRANPETGLIVTLVGGFTLGLLISALIRPKGY